MAGSNKAGNELAVGRLDLPSEGGSPPFGLLMRVSAVDYHLHLKSHAPTIGQGYDSKSIRLERMFE